MREVSLWFINDGRGILTNPTKCFRIKPPVIAGPEKEGLFSGACEGPSSGVHFLTLDVCTRQKLLKEGAGGWGDKDQKWPPVAWGVCIGWPCIPVCLEQTRSYLLLWLSSLLRVQIWKMNYMVILGYVWGLRKNWNIWGLSEKMLKVYYGMSWHIRSSQNLKTRRPRALVTSQSPMPILPHKPLTSPIPIPNLHPSSTGKTRDSNSINTFMLLLNYKLCSAYQMIFSITPSTPLRKP